MTPLPSSVRTIVVHRCSSEDCGAQFATYGPLPRDWSLKDGEPICRMCRISEARRKARRNRPWKR